MIDLEFIEGLIRAVDDSGVDSIEIERGGTRIRVAKTPNGTAAVAPHAGSAPPSVVQHAPAGTAAPSPAAQSPGTAAQASAETPSPPVDDGLVAVESPMVGTFYRAPAPDTEPYVEVGSQVGEGDVLCIIEAMKLMNELESEMSGTIAEILVENAEPVEYGQVLFKVTPA